MKKPALIIADMDGTIAPKSGNVSDYTRTVFKKLHDLGILFCCASGRPADEVFQTVKDFRFGFEPEFVVGMNGGEILNTKTNKLKRYHLLPRETVQKLCEAMEKENCIIRMYKNGKIYSSKDDDSSIRSALRANKPLYTVKQLSEMYDDENAKVMFYAYTPENCLQLQEKARALNMPGIAFFRTQPFMLEACDERVNKGMALEKICEEENIPVEGVYAFGDASNDNEMLKKAGTAIALANGLEDTKALADYITPYPCEEDGMARWLEEYVLK